MGNDSNSGSPIAQQRDLTKLPRALAPLIQRPQWAVWRWTQKSDGKWQKPPFQALQPKRHASTSDPSTWTDYTTALAAVQAGHADGISYILTEADPFGAIDPITAAILEPIVLMCGRRTSCSAPSRPIRKDTLWCRRPHLGVGGWR